MKMLITLFSFLLFSSITYGQNRFDIINIYKASMPEIGTKVVTMTGLIEDVETILSPTTLDDGKYSFSITRKGNNLYRVNGTSFYLEKQFCYEYVYFQDVILFVRNSKYYKGELIFVK